MPYSKPEAIVFLVFMMIFILVMVSFIIVTLFFIQRKQKGFTEDLIIVKANYDKELYKAQLEIQEQTLEQIALEIHDNVGQILSLAKLGLGMLDLEKKEEAKESIGEISDIVEKALDDLRHMSRSMNAEIVKKGGLKKSIEMQVGFLQRGGRFDIQFDVTGKPVALDGTKEIILFRIVQEAINNIIRHSDAGEIHISLSYGTDFLKLKIRDNGNGFDLNEQMNGPNQINGLYNMQHRAKLIGSELKMETAKGKGTSITITVLY